MDSNSQIIEDNMPTVSILMLTYNRAKYIGEAIESVCKQTYQDWQLIIIDDGSTDNTAEIIKQITDPRIRYIRHTKNTGLHARRRESLTYTTGVYTAILDSDDIWTDPGKLAEQVAHLDTNPATVVVGTFITLIDENSNRIGGNKYHTSDQAIRDNLLARNQFTHSSVLMRTNSLTRVAGYRDTDLAEDLDLFLQLGTIGKLANLPKYMTAYRVHTASFNPQRLRMSKAVLKIIKTHRDNYPNYHKALVKSYLRILYRYLF